MRCFDPKGYVFIPLAIVAVTISIAALTRSASYAQTSNPFLAEDAQNAAAKYLGTSACRKCHDQVALGNQYGVWRSGPHSETLGTLATEKAWKIAGEQGIADPRTAPQCLRCHTIAEAPDPEEGIGCEGCHGPAEKYIKAKIFSSAAAVKLGMVVHPDAQVCERCHNSDCPTFPGFDFESMWEAIAHPMPAGVARPH